MYLDRHLKLEFDVPGIGLAYQPIDELVIALPAKYLHTVEDAMTICDEEGVPVRIVSPFFKNLISKAKTDMIQTNGMIQGCLPFPR